MTEQKHPASKASRALANHIELIGHAISHQHAIIDFSAESEPTIKSLNKAGLGYFDFDANGFVLHSNIVRFVSYYDRQGRINNNTGQIASLINEIKDSAEFYVFAKQKNTQDTQIYHAQLKELIIQLSSVLIENCLNFSSQVYEHLIVLSDLEVRIKANEIAIERLKHLSDTISILTPDKLFEIGAVDKELERLLTRRLAPTLFSCQKELLNAGHVLNEYLLRWKKDLEIQQKNNLVDALHRFLKSNRLRPQLDDTYAPSEFFAVTRSNLTAYADLSSPDDQEIYRELAVKANEKSEHRFQVEAEIDIAETITKNEEILIKPSALQLAVVHFFEAIQHQQSQQQLSAVSCYEILKPEININSWLLTLVSYFRDHQSEFELPLALHFIEEQLPNYDGNRLVYDIIVKKI